MTTPVLAVVTPAYNDAAFLAACCESVARATEVSGLAVEHAVVDDASTDGTAAMLPDLTRTYGLLTQRLPTNRGCSAALNAAVRITTAPWLLVLASDDLVLPTAFQDWHGALRAHPDSNVIYSDLELFGAQRGFYTTPAFSQTLLREKSIIPGCSFLRRELFAAVGGFDESMRTAQDWDFWVRADLVVGLAPKKLSLPLVRYRYHHRTRLHNESVRDIGRIRLIIAGRTAENSVLAAEIAA